jgi:hypothetical protein
MKRPNFGIDAATVARNFVQLGAGLIFLSKLLYFGLESALPTFATTFWHSFLWPGVFYFLAMAG